MSLLCKVHLQSQIIYNKYQVTNSKWGYGSICTEGAVGNKGRIYMVIYSITVLTLCCAEDMSGR